MKKQLLTSMVSTALMVGSMAAPSAFAESPHTFSANVALTTDYVFRGYTQNNEDPSIQGGFDYEHESGFYAGVWGAAVDFNNANVELDYYVGYGNEFGGTGIGYDVGVLYYDYPNSTGGVETTEVHVGLSYDFGPAAVSGTWYHSTDYFAANDADTFEIGVDVPLPSDFALAAVWGTTNYDDSVAKGGGDDYDYYSLGLSKEFGGFGFDLSYHDTSGVSGGSAACKDICDDRIVFTVSKSF